MWSLWEHMSPARSRLISLSTTFLPLRYGWFKNCKELEFYDIFLQVLAVHENTSEELLKMFEIFCDYFRNSNLNLDDEEFRYE